MNTMKCVINNYRGQPIKATGVISSDGKFVAACVLRKQAEKFKANTKGSGETTVRGMGDLTIFTKHGDELTEIFSHTQVMILQTRDNGELRPPFFRTIVDGEFKSFSGANRVTQMKEIIPEHLQDLVLSALNVGSENIEKNQISVNAKIAKATEIWASASYSKSQVKDAPIQESSTESTESAASVFGE